MICPSCGAEELHDRKRFLDWRGPGAPPPITVHRECSHGHAWHIPLVIKPNTRPAICDCPASV